MQEYKIMHSVLVQVICTAQARMTSSVWPHPISNFCPIYFISFLFYWLHFEIPLKISLVPRANFLLNSKVYSETSTSLLGISNWQKTMSKRNSQFSIWISIKSYKNVNDHLEIPSMSTQNLNASIEGECFCQQGTSFKS
jgi:hypothetical protein